MMNKIIPIAAIIVGIVIASVVVLFSTPSISYVSMSCDELRDEVFYASSYLPTTSSEVKEQLKNLETIHKIQEEKNCENMIIDSNKIIDESIKSALTFNKEPTQETATQELVYESLLYFKGGDFTHMNNSMTQDPINGYRYVTINSDSYTAGDVIEITVMFDTDLHAEFADWTQGEEPNREYMRIDIQREKVSQDSGRVVYHKNSSQCKLFTDYHVNGTKTDVTSEGDFASPCIANEDGSFSYTTTLDDDIPAGNYRVQGEHSLRSFQNFYFSNEIIGGEIRHAVYSHPFEVVPGP